MVPTITLTDLSSPYSKRSTEISRAVTFLAGILSLTAAAPMATAQPSTASAQCAGEDFSRTVKNDAGGKDVVSVNVKAGTATVDRNNGQIIYTANRALGADNEDFTSAEIFENSPQSGASDIGDTPERDKLAAEITRIAWRRTALCFGKG